MLDPESLVKAAKRAGLSAIAVTDHDTAAGIEPARKAAASSGGPIVIPGIELTTSFLGEEVHLLGYAIDSAHPAIAGFAGRAAALRLARMREIVEKLRQLGVPIAESDVVVEPGCASVGRPHVAQALVRLKAASSVQDAFNRYLADGARAYVPSRGPDVEVGIETVGAAGGVSVWAHPSLDDSRHFGGLAAKGLGGVETLRPSVEPAVSLALEQEARACGLLVTGGSDWHGQQRPALGAFYVTEKHVGAFLDRIGLSQSP